MDDDKDQALAVIQAIIDMIKDDRDEEISPLLEKLPLDKLENEQSDNLLNRFLSLCAEYNRPLCVKPILKTWEEKIYQANKEISFFSTLFLHPLFSDQLLRFLSIVFKDTTAQEILSEIIFYDPGSMTIQACAKVISAYGEQSRDVYNNLLHEADDYDNHEVYNFLIAKLEQTAEYVQTPEWVKNFTSHEVPKVSEIKIAKSKPVEFDIPDIETAVNLLTDGLKTEGIAFEDLEEAQTAVRRFWSIATYKEKVELIKPVMNKISLASLQDDIELFRILGPANPQLNASENELEYGGWRMFISNIFDIDYDTDQSVDWFRGACDHCHLKIRYYWYALRIPQVNGGWSGCYCSFDCLREGLVEQEIRENDGVPDLLTTQMIELLEDQIYERGIQERIPD